MGKKKYNMDVEVESSIVKEDSCAYYNSTNQHSVDHLRRRGMEELSRTDDVILLNLIVADIDKLIRRYTSAGSVNRDRLQRKLAEFERYGDDWDGEGAVAIPGESIYNVNEVLGLSSDMLLAGWSLFAASNGTLTFEKHKDGSNAVFSIGTSQFSYSIHDKHSHISGIEPFQSNRFIELMDYATQRTA